MVRQTQDIQSYANSQPTYFWHFWVWFHLEHNLVCSFQRTSSHSGCCCSTAACLMLRLTTTTACHNLVAWHCCCSTSKEMTSATYVLHTKNFVRTKIYILLMNPKLGKIYKKLITYCILKQYIIKCTRRETPYIFYFWTVVYGLQFQTKKNFLRCSFLYLNLYKAYTRTGKT